jgi:NADH:ubiquinone reductase (non-electrogenic)
MTFLSSRALKEFGITSYNYTKNRSLGDCAATKFAPTAQVAAQQGTYLARLFNTMARTEQIESEIEALRTQPPSPELKSEIESKQRQLSKVKLMKPFEYSHQGSLAYIGSDKAVADLPFGFKGGNVAAGGQLTYYFWRSAYLSKLFSLRNRTLVALDWIKVKVFGRDISRA